MRRIRGLWGAAAVMAALVLTGCMAAPQPVVTRLPTDDSARSTAEPTATPAATTTPAQTTAPIPAVTPAAPSVAPSSDPAAEGALDCGGSTITLAGNTQTFRITGDCPDLRVEGNGVLVQGTGARVGAVTVSGDRIELQLGVIGGVTVQGNDITTLVTSVGTAVVRGDRNRVEASASIGSALVVGNENVVTSPRTGTVDDQGQRNTVA